MTGALRTATLIYREKRLARRIRRAVDVTIALLLLLAVAPVILVACAAILVEDGPPVFFRQRRAGRFERTFVIYKLRTMKRAACGDEMSPATVDDRRITPVGRLLRRTSIDELPQLFNVLRGEMSLIGPRPEMQSLVQRYEPWQHLRHLIAPGITCIWQTTCRSTVPLHRPEATALDLEYIERASPLFDVALLARTITSVLSQRGAF
ncbi:MAG: sugar transferase [Candidatus Eremiobacteraeota bacterium]|nr:sugar transferase [Candidatus Eremiobacteraeota bacterium]